MVLAYKTAISISEEHRPGEGDLTTREVGIEELRIRYAAKAGKLDEITNVRMA